MKKVLFATSNISKVNRFKEKLLKRGIEILSLNDLGIELSVNEDGIDAVENALIKAREAVLNLGEINMPVFAMDDSLYLENVPESMQPGLYVRRVNGKRLSDEEMIEHYTNLAKTYGEDGKLTGRWVYGMAVISDKKEYTYTWSKENFYIVDKPHEKKKEGYPLNCISVNKKLNKYFPDLTEEDKMLIKEDETDVIDFIENSVK